MMKIVVITGGIGSGKSEVCRILHEAGITAQYNADQKVKELYLTHPTLLSSIEEALGCVLRDSDGRFQPSLLASRIFAEPDSLKKVEDLVFPVLREDFESYLADHSDHGYVIFESATILEKPQFDGFGDVILLVDAPYEVRLSRACTRDEVRREAIEARMANQKLMNALSAGETDPRIHAVIRNDSDMDALISRTYETMTVLFGDWKR